MCHEGWSSAVGPAASVAVGIPLSTGAILPSLRCDPPPGVSHRAPCVVVTDIFGMVPFYREVSRLLAAAGHTTFLLDSFFREGPLPEPTREAAFARRSRMDERRGIADVAEAVGFARGVSGAARVGVVGFCIGGLFALDLATERHDIVAVSFYGFPEGISAPVRIAAPRPIDRVGLIQSPILAFWGDSDHNVPVEQVNRFAAATKAAGVDCEIHVFAGAGHGFLQGVLEQRDDSVVAHEAWARTLAVLSERTAE